MTTRRHISPRERVAIFQRDHGRCYLCSEKIGLSERWDIEHELPLALGGDEAPMSPNLRPAHAACHRVKSSTDAWNLAKAKRREARHLSCVGSRSPLPGGRKSKWKRKVSGEVVRRCPD